MDTTTAQEKRRIARERELEADMATASDLMGSTGVEDGMPVPLSLGLAAEWDVP